MPDHSSRTSVEPHSQSDELSCANSAVSVDFQEQLASTIGKRIFFSFLLSVMFSDMCIHF